LLLVLPIVGSVLSAQSFVILSHVSCVLRGCVVPALYKKSLVLSSAAKLEYSSGKIVNMFSNDLTHIQNFVQHLAEPLFAPAQLIVALGLIYAEVGVSMFVGFGLIF
jgi:ABC-type transport system involved in cytochrome bd biosynthesis fused ATPase/permease subunit